MTGKVVSLGGDYGPAISNILSNLSWFQSPDEAPDIVQLRIVELSQSAGDVMGDSYMIIVR